MSARRQGRMVFDALPEQVGRTLGLELGRRLRVTQELQARRASRLRRAS